MPTLHYRTGWPGASLHLSDDCGSSWRQEPFLPACPSPIGPDFHVIDLPASLTPIRFVPTDPTASPPTWDNPSPDCPPELRADDSNAYLMRDSSADAVYVLYSGVMSQHRRTLRKAGLSIVTDIDGTLHGCDASLVDFYNLWARELALSGAHLVYNTGRSIESTTDLIASEEGRMPTPVAAVTRVGGFVHWFRADCGRGAWEADSPVEDAGWRRARVDLAGWDATCIPAARAVMEELIADVDEDGEPPAHWLCNGEGEPECVQICVGVRAEAATRFASTLLERLSPRPLKLIMSGQGSHRYLDVTISSGGKLGGTRYVVDRLPGESSRVENVVFSGDSGNDIDALEGDLKGTIVGNVQDDLRAHHEKSRLKNDAVYDVHLVEPGFARGIVQGLRQHGFLSESP